MGILLSENELYKLHQRSKWDDEKGDWNIPLFTFNPKAKDISFPTINGKQRVDQMKDERVIDIKEADHSDNADADFRKAGNFNGNTNNNKRSKKKQSGAKNFSQSRPVEKNPAYNHNHSADETTS